MADIDRRNKTVTRTQAVSFVVGILFLAALVLSGIVAALYQMRMRRLQAREKKLTALVEERTYALSESEKRFGGLADELDNRVNERTIAVVHLNEALQGENQELRSTEEKLARAKE